MPPSFRDSSHGPNGTLNLNPPMLFPGLPARKARRAKPASRAGCCAPCPRGGTWRARGACASPAHVLKDTLETINLDPPMILPWCLVSWRMGSGLARFAGAGRAAPTRRVAHREGRREGRLGDSGDVLKGTHKTLNALKGTLKTSTHVPKTPLTSHTQPAQPAKRPRPQSGPRPPNLACRTSPAGPCGRADPREDHRWIQVQRPEGHPGDGPKVSLAGHTVRRAYAACQARCAGRTGETRPLGHRWTQDQRPEGAPL